MGRRIRSLLWTALVAAGLLWSAAPHPSAAQPGSRSQAELDSLNRAVLWNDIVSLQPAGRIADVAFTSVGRNIVTPIEMVWALADSTHELVAIAARPIQGTADAGEEMGRRGAAILRAPVAMHSAQSGSYVLQADGHLVVLRSGAAADSIDLGLAAGTARDVCVSTGGLVYVLTRDDVRVYTDPPARAPVWKFALPAALGSGVAFSVSTRGEVFVLGEGKQALAMFDLDATGTYRLVRGVTPAQLGLGRAAGIAVVPSLLLPVEGREGWVNEDRFVAVTDREKRALLVLDAGTLKVLGRVDLAKDAPGLEPGRIDISTRGQVAVVDARTQRGYSLPTRLLAVAMDTAPVKWRRIGAVGDSTHTAPADSARGASKKP